jgi:Ca-activated chloride channel family protein
MSAPGAVLVAAALLAAPSQAPRTPPVFSAEVEAVYLDVFVTSRGEPVLGLKTDDFEVRDNGVVQSARLVDLRTVGVTAILVFDTSGSVAGEKLAYLKAAGHAFVEALTERDSAALLNFSHEVILQCPSTRERAPLHAALDRIEARGATAVRDALYLALKLPRNPGRPLVVLFTDGEDNISWSSSEEVLTAARESDALVSVVASTEADDGTSPPPRGGRLDKKLEILLGTRLPLLRSIAEITGGTVWGASATGLRGAFDDILAAMRTRYLLTYTPEGVERLGRHRIQVSLRNRRGDVRARTEYSISH